MVHTIVQMFYPTWFESHSRNFSKFFLCSKTRDSGEPAGDFVTRDFVRATPFLVSYPGKLCATRPVSVPGIVRARTPCPVSVREILYTATPCPVSQTGNLCTQFVHTICAHNLCTNSPAGCPGKGVEGAQIPGRQPDCFRGLGKGAPSPPPPPAPKVNFSGALQANGT